jgi:DNA-binding transcriptional ArsR family regulator
LLCDRADRHSTAKCHGRSVSAVRPDCQEAALLIRCAEAKSRSSGELASVIGRDKGRVTRHLDELEARGLIERFTSSRDRRVTLVPLLNLAANWRLAAAKLFWKRGHNSLENFLRWKSISS